MEDEGRVPTDPSTPESASRSARWLSGPVVDLFLGCGVGYVVVTVLLFISGATQPLALWAPFAIVVLAIVTNTPHYGATLLRVYEHRSDRRRYGFFAVHATLLIFGLFAGGLYWAPLGSLLLTVYASWSPWHFAGQNYGLALMFLRRRGVPVDARTKRLLYTSFVLSFLITFFALHGGGGRLHLTPAPEEVSVHYDFLSIGIPDSISLPALWICGSAYVVTLVAAAASLLRRARVIDLGPSAMLVLLQALWFSIPALLVLRGEQSAWNVTRTTIWVSVFHSIQYLWVSSYYARQTGDSSRSTYLGKTLLAGAGLTVLPALLFMPALLGTIPFDAGLGLVLFAAVNIHHFMLDGVIWKLRDGRIARALLRAEPTTPEPIAPENRLGRRLVWLACAGALGIYVVNGWELEFGVRRPSERGDFARQEKAIQRLRWIGRESHAVQYNLGFGLARDGQLLAARPHLERSLELYPTAKTWTALGNLEHVEGRYAAALSALDAAIALDSGYEIAHKRRGEVLATMGELDAALDALGEAERLAPDNPNIRDSLERVKRWRASADAAGSANTGRPPPP